MQRQISSISATTLKQIDSYQYPNTHVGHLSQQQLAALEKFKSLCIEEGLYKPGSKDGQKPSHDDEALLRYLRARKFIPQEGLLQFKETEEWRAKNQIGNLYETIDVHDFDATRELYPQWIGRRDKRGIPVYVFEVAPLTSKRLAEYDKNTKKIPNSGNIPPKLFRLVALYENLVTFILPLCSSIPTRPYPETPVSQSNNIVDISKVGLKQFWNLKGHMQDASQLATAHYPETLDRIFIIGAPSFFPTVWGWIKRWFDPITVSKIFILSASDVKKTLEQYIDPENIPKKYGGKLEWEWGQMPNLDDAVQDVLMWKKGEEGPGGRETFPKGPIRWEESKNGETAAVAVGSVDNQPRKEVIATLRTGEDNLAVDPTDTLYGPPSTSGIHTHPSHQQEYFPPSGHTPTEEDEPEPNMAEEDEATAGHGFVTAFVTPMEPEKEPGHVPRDGTSLTRSQQQEDTHAEGHLVSGTPATVDWGNGDKTVTMEPGTVGQAQKAVHTPQPEEKSETTYIEHAKAAASTAIHSGSEAISHAMAAVGLGGHKKDHEENPAEEIEKPPPHDPKIDQMEVEKVEEYIRNQYATHSNNNNTNTVTSKS